MFDQRVEQVLADTVVLLVAAHADQFDAQPRLLAAELADQHARQQVADQPLRADGGELRVPRRLAQRRVEAAPDVGAPRAALDGLVDGDHRVEVARLQRSVGDLRRDGGFGHGVAPVSCRRPRRGRAPAGRSANDIGIRIPI